MKNFWIVFCGLWISCWACSEDKLTGYSSDSYIYFSKDSADSTIFSFAYDPSLTEGELTLKLNIISGIEEYSRTFNMCFLSEESTAREGVHFEIENENQCVAAGDSVGYLTLKIKKGDLNKNAVRAVFELVESNDFKVGLQANAKTKIIISDRLSKPEWWDDWHETSGLGGYSNLKYETFIAEIGEHDLTLDTDGGNLTYSERRVLILRFKRILEQSPRLDEDGSIMSVAING